MSKNRRGKRNSVERYRRRAFARDQRRRQRQSPAEATAGTDAGTDAEFLASLFAEMAMVDARCLAKFGPKGAYTEAELEAAMAELEAEHDAGSR